MNFTIKKRKDLHIMGDVRSLLPNGSHPPHEPPKFQDLMVPFTCPVGFQPAMILVVAMDKESRPFTFSPGSPNVGLYLATKALDYASQIAIEAMQAQVKPVIIPAQGPLPPFPHGQEERR